MRVEVYRNIRDHSKWSIRSKKTGRVVQSLPARVRLENARFVVHESGRQKVLATRQKNVHAWVEGDLVEWEGEPDIDSVDRVLYDPYRWETFVRRADGAALESAAEVFFGLNGRVNARGLEMLAPA